MLGSCDADKGGGGGAGDGGAGGPSACFAHAATVVYQYTPLSCTLGAPGAGAAGGTNPQGGIGAPGTAGVAASDLVIP
jgi:hypothetical protein